MVLREWSISEEHKTYLFVDSRRFLCGFPMKNRVLNRVGLGGDLQGSGVVRAYAKTGRYVWAFCHKPKVPFIPL